MKKRLAKSLYSEEWEVLLRILKEARLRRGLTQQQLAQKPGRPQSLVAKIEAGERKLEVCQLIDYPRILETDPVATLRRLIKRLPDAERKA